ncbi:MAG: PEP-CTERM sorting domain-containing protein [Terriglobales bacterium]
MLGVNGNGESTFYLQLDFGCGSEGCAGGFGDPLVTTASASFSEPPLGATTTPEPATLALLGAGLLLFGTTCARRRAA